MRLGPLLLSVAVNAACATDIAILDTGARAGADASVTGADGSVISRDAGLIADSGGQQAADCKRTVTDDFSVPAPPLPEAFSGVRALGFDRTGRLFVLNIAGPAPYTSWVLVFGPAPRHDFVRVIGRGSLGRVQDMVVESDGRLHVLEYDSGGGGGPPGIVVFSAVGVFERRWAPSMQPNAFSLGRDGTGRLYVGGYVVTRYASDGTFTDAIGVEGPGLGQMEVATSLAIGPRGNVWVADLFRNNIHQWDRVTGAHVLEFGGKGNGEPGKFDNARVPMGDFFGPANIAIDGRGSVYANDPANFRLQKFSPQGSFLAAFDFGGSMTFGPMALEPSSGNIYIGRRTGVDILCPF